MSFFTRASTAVSNEIADVADVEEEGPSSFEDPLPFFTLCSDHAGPHPSLLPSSRPAFVPVRSGVTANVFRL